MEVAEGHAEPMPKRSGVLDVEDCLEAEPLFALSEALPTEEGWYWWKHPSGNYRTIVVQVYGDSSGDLIVYGINNTVYKIGGLWSQRIPEPSEA